MRQLIQPQTIALTVTAFLVGILTDVLKDFLLQGGIPMLGAIGVGAIVLTGVVVYYRLRHQPAIIVKSTLTLRQEVDLIMYGRKGLIVFVSLYNQRESDPAKRLTVAQREEAMSTRDYARLGVAQSNWEPIIKSITSHKWHLKYCWFISTQVQDNPAKSSLSYTPVLADYLRTVENLADCQFFGADDNQWAISLDDDAQVALKTRDKVELTFQKAHELGLTDKDIIADFTGCPRSMTLGMIWACLNKERDIQFAGTKYDAQGDPEGGIYPVLFDFETVIVEA